MNKERWPRLCVFARAPPSPFLRSSLVCSTRREKAAPLNNVRPRSRPFPTLLYVP